MKAGSDYQKVQGLEVLGHLKLSYYFACNKRLPFNFYLEGGEAGGSVAFT